MPYIVGLVPLNCRVESLSQPPTRPVLPYHKTYEALTVWEEGGVGEWAGGFFMTLAGCQRAFRELGRSAGDINGKHHV